MITKFDQYKLITEDPDSIEYEDGTELPMDSGDGIPFITNVNKTYSKVINVFIGDFGEWHDDVDFPGRNKAYPGRIWTDHKIMSFWVYPDVKLFKEIIKILEKKLKTNIFNNGWKIEVIYGDDDEIEMKKFDPESDDDDYFSGDDTDYNNTKIISVDEYSGSEDVPEENKIRHLMNWKEKELAKKFGKIHFGGFGSALTAWDKPHNIKYRQAIRTSENRKFL